MLVSIEMDANDALAYLEDRRMRIMGRIWTVRRAIDAITNKKPGRLPNSIVELLSANRTDSTPVTSEPAPRKRRKMSAKGKANIAAAQRLRWHREKLRKEVARVKKIRIV